MKKLYSIFDAVSKEFAGPWLDNNDAAASRRFSGWITQNSNQVGFKSTDYYLYCVGEFDLSSGDIVPNFYEVPLNAGQEDA